MGYSLDDGKVEVVNPRDGDLTNIEAETDYASKNFVHLLERVEHDYKHFELRPEHLIELADSCYSLIKGDGIKIKDDRKRTATKKSMNLETIKQETASDRVKFMFEG